MSGLKPRRVTLPAERRAFRGRGKGACHEKADMTQQKCSIEKGGERDDQG